MSHESNYELASVQMNRTEISTVPNSLATALAEFGNLHHDSHDEKNGFTVMYSLSNFPDDSHFPGRFNITEPRITATLPTFSALIFKGVLSHYATGEGQYLDHSSTRYRLENGLEHPQLPDDRKPKRFNVVCFPNNDVLILNPKFVTGEFKEDIRTGEALTQYGTMRNMKTWEMRTALREDFFETRTTDHIIPSEWCQRYAWTNDNGVEESPELWVAEDFKRMAPEDATFPKNKRGKKQDPVLASKEYILVEKAIRANLCGLRFHDDSKKKDDTKTKKKSRVNPQIIYTHKEEYEQLFQVSDSVMPTDGGSDKKSKFQEEEPELMEEEPEGDDDELEEDDESEEE